jgi:integrase
MPTTPKYLHYKRGRFSARIVVPKELQTLVGKKELTKALGADRRAAEKQLPGAVTVMMHELAVAERKLNAGKPVPTEARFPMAPPALAASHYEQRLAFDDQLRNDPRYAAIGVDDQYAQLLRNGMSGKLTDAELMNLIGARIERFRFLGNVTAEPGSDEWRQIARALCVAEYEALSRVVERDEGDFTGKPSHPLIVNSQATEDVPEPVILSKLWSDYLATRMQAGFIKDGGKRQEPVIKSLRAFLKHNEAQRVTKKDLLLWRDHLLNVDKLSAKTINDIYLSTIRSLFSWAHENERLIENVAASVRQPKPRKTQSRERGYTDTEALAVLIASRSHVPKPNQFSFVRETPHMTAAKHWAPMLCAFSGARISEITQLRKEDFRKEGQHWIMRITPDAGTVKAGGWRDVPLHRQIVALGFIEFVKAAAEGPLFHGAVDPSKYATAAASVSDELAKWLRRSGTAPDGVQPNHAWRHRLKTLGRELGLSDRVIDAIQGHAGRTADDSYGDVTISAKLRVIDALPEYDLKVQNL